jgi:hypothetical protein
MTEFSPRPQEPVPDALAQKPELWDGAPPTPHVLDPKPDIWDDALEPAPATATIDW